MIDRATEERALDRFHAIAGALARADDLGPDLAAGVALFFAYRYQASGDDADADRMCRTVPAVGAPGSLGTTAVVWDTAETCVTVWQGRPVPLDIVNAF